MAEWTIRDPQRLSIDEPVDRLDVRLVSGRLNVVGAEGPARLEVSAIGSRALEVTLRDGVLSLSLEKVSTGWWWLGPVWWFMSGRKAFTTDVSVGVPPETAAKLHLTSGSLVVSGLRAGTEADVTSGRVTLLGLGGRVRAKTVSGPVEALGVGGDVDLETVSGEVVVADSSADQVRARTVSGAITADLDNSPYDNDIRLETISGEVTARVPEDSDLSVDLFAVSGRVTSAFEPVQYDGTIGRRNRASGVLGSGSGQLRVHTTSGNISLLSRPVDDEEGYPDGEGDPEPGEAPQRARTGEPAESEASGTEPR